MAAARTARAATTTLLGRLIVAPCCRSAAAAWSPPGAVGGSGRWSSAAPAAALPLAGGARTFAASASPAEDLPSSASERVTKVASEILSLNLLEVAELTELLQDRLGVAAPAFGGFAAGAPAAPGAAPGGAPAAAAPAAEEKTEFTVKLDGFADGEKLKVIKEVRAATQLGLKEAKELVEKSPIVVKAGMKKEEADELKAKLEAAGGKVSLE